MKSNIMKSTILLILGLFFIFSATSADAALVARKPAVAPDSESAETLISNLRIVKAASILWFADNADLSDVDVIRAWNNTTMIPIVRDYLDNPEIAKQLDFKVVSIINRFVYLVGKYADVKVIHKAIGQAGGILFKSDGVTPATRGDSIVYMRVR